MGIAYYLFNKDTNECVYLGKKGVRDDFEYEGPLLYIGEQRYLLPVDYLKLLIERFNDTGGENSILTVSSDDLFDTECYVSEDEDIIEIGGDNYLDLPLTKYLPELNGEGGKANVVRNGIEIT